MSANQHSLLEVNITSEGLNIIENFFNNKVSFSLNINIVKYTIFGLVTYNDLRVKPVVKIIEHYEESLSINIICQFFK